MSVDDDWALKVACLDAVALRTLLAEMHLARQDQAERMAVVEMIVDLDPDPPCDCDYRWCTSRTEHDPTCALLDGCTCERRWTGGGQTIAAHAATCKLRNQRTVWPPPDSVHAAPAKSDDVSGSAASPVARPAGSAAGSAATAE